MNRPENERPPRATDEDLAEMDLDQPPITPSGGVGGGGLGGRKLNFGGAKNSSTIGTIVIALVVTVVVLFAFNLFGGVFFVSKTDFTNNLSGVANDIKTIKSDVNTKMTDVNTTVSGIPTIIGKEIDKSIANINNQFATINTKLSGYDTKIQDANTNANKALTATNDLSTKIGSMPSSTTDLNTKIVDLNTKIADLTKLNSDLATKITDLTTKLTALEIRIKALEDKMVASSGGGTTTITDSGVTAIIVGNWLTNTLSIEAITTEVNPVGVSFGIKVSNNTGKKIKDVQLGIGFGLYNGNNPYSLPSDVKATLSSSGNLALIWADAQFGNSRKIVLFTNQVNTGLFGFGNLTQDVGDVLYTQIFELTSEHSTTTPVLTIIPTVQVIKYTEVK